MQVVNITKTSLLWCLLLTHSLQTAASGIRGRNITNISSEIFDSDLNVASAVKTSRYLVGKGEKRNPTSKGILQTSSRARSRPTKPREYNSKADKLPSNWKKSATSRSTNKNKRLSGSGKKKSTASSSSGGKKQRSGNREIDNKNHGQKVNICHYDDATESYTNIYISSNSAALHLEKKPVVDYLGMCRTTISNIRVHAFIPGLTYENENQTFVTHTGHRYQMESETTIHSGGVVALAAVENMIRTVTCSTTVDKVSMITVEFKEELPGSTATYLFPVGSIVAIPGGVFGSCKWTFDEPDEQEDEDPADGYLLVEKAIGAGTIFQVTGAPKMFFHLFDKLDFNYAHEIQSRDLGELNKNWTVTYPPVESPIRATANADLTGEASYISDFHLQVLDAHVKYTGNFILDMSFAVGIKVVFKHSESWPWDNEIDFVSYPALALPIPPLLNKLLKDSAELGIYLKVPFYMKAELAFEVELEVRADTSVSTGRKEIGFVIEIDKNMWTENEENIDFQIIENEAPSTSGLSMSTGPPEDNDSVATMSLNVFLGLKYKIELKIFGLGSVEIGFVSGLAASLKGTGLALPPYQKDDVPYKLSCDDCHTFELDFSFKLGDPFATYRTFLSKEPTEIDMPEFSYEDPLAKICLIRHASSITCGSKCCASNGACISNEPPSEPECCYISEPNVECCSDADCNDPSSPNQASCQSNSCTSTCVVIVEGSDCCSSEDCTNPSLPLCQSNVCVEDTTCQHQCCSDSDCQEFGYPICNPSGECVCALSVAHGIACCSSDDCADDRFECSNHSCVKRQCDSELPAFQCCDDTDCENSNYECHDDECRLIECDMSIVQCCDDSDCDTGLVCSSNVCLANGNPRFTLSWIGDDDLDLHVRTPGESEIWYSHTYDSDSGGELDHDDIPREGDSTLHVENIFFPMDGTAPLGLYTYFVQNYHMWGEVNGWTLELYGGETLLRRNSGTTMDSENSQQFSYLHVRPPDVD